MNEKIKKIGIIIFKFILSIIVVIGIFAILCALSDTNAQGSQAIFALSSILSAFILGLIYRKEI